MENNNQNENLEEIETTSKKKNKWLVIWLLILLMILLAWWFYYIYTTSDNSSINNSEKTPQNTDIEEQNNNEWQNIGNEVKNDNTGDLNTNLESNESETSTWTTLENKSVDDNNSINISDIDEDSLSEEELKMKAMLEELEKKNNVEAVVIDEDKVYVYNGIIHIKSDFIGNEEWKLVINSKWYERLEIEKDSIVDKLVTDWIRTKMNNFNGEEFTYKDYWLKINDKYNIDQVSKNWENLANSNLLGVSIFEVKNFYKK